jgi:glycerol uptake facilitator-like aquaporin
MTQLTFSSQDTPKFDHRKIALYAVPAILGLVVLAVVVYFWLKRYIKESGTRSGEGEAQGVAGLQWWDCGSCDCGSCDCGSCAC